MSTLPEVGLSSSPYPGLRPFRRDEADIFFGREEQIDSALAKLEQCRLLSVVGSSGCGKSSLVRAGMLSALDSGFMATAGVHWQVAEMRPGNQPFVNLARALLNSQVLPGAWSKRPDASSFLQATLRRGPLGLVEVLREARQEQAGLQNPQANFVLLVDQFEEIFRFRELRDANEATAFVDLLLAAAKQTDVSAFVVLTMRSDFLGDCSIFDGLPEIINAGQFLIPRMNREQCRAAILGPAAVFDVDVEPALVNRVLNDMGTDPDQLPLMQHVLMRVWSESNADDAEPAKLTLEKYEQDGGLRSALSNHADELFEGLSFKNRRIAEVMFRSLTERSSEQRDTRRPARLADIAQIAQTSCHDLRKVVDIFRHPQCSFLTPPLGVELDDDTVLDIGHESLIRQWTRMNQWVRSEAQSASIYRRLAETARLWKTGHAAVWTTPDLENALAWKEMERPNEHWAQRYGGGFDSAMLFLDASIAEREKSEQAEEERQQREMDLLQEVADTEKRRADDAEQQRVEQERAHQRMRRWAYVAGFAGVVAAALAVVAFTLFAEAQNKRQQADFERKIAKDAQKKESAARQKADALAVQADKDRKKAVKLADVAKTAENNAVSQTLSAYQSLAQAKLAQADSLWTANVPNRRRRALELIGGIGTLRSSSQALLPNLGQSPSAQQTLLTNSANWDRMLPQMRTQATRWLTGSSLRLIRTFRVDNNHSKLCRVNAYGSRLSVFITQNRAAMSGRLQLLDPRSGELIQETAVKSPPGTRELIRDMRFSPDGKHLIVALFQMRIRSGTQIHAVIQVRQLPQLNIIKSTKLTGSIRSPRRTGRAGRSGRSRLSSSGKLFATSAGGKITIWDTATGKRLPAIAGRLLSLAGDKWVLAQDAQYNLRVFDIQTGKLLRTIPTDSAGFIQAAGRADGRWIVIALPPKVTATPLVIVDGRSGKIIGTTNLTRPRFIYGFAQAISIGFHPTKDVAVIAEGPHTNLISLSRGQILKRYRSQRKAPQNISNRYVPAEVHIGPQGSCLTIGGSQFGAETTVRFWDIAVSDVDQQSLQVPDGLQAATLVGTRELVVATQRTVQASGGTGPEWKTTYPLYRSGFSPNGTHYLEIFPQQVVVWQAQTGKTIASIQTTHPQNSARFFPSSSRRWIPGYPDKEKRLALFDANSGKPTMTLSDPTRQVLSVGFDPTDTYAQVHNALAPNGPKALPEFHEVFHLPTKKSIVRVIGSQTNTRLTKSGFFLCSTRKSNQNLVRAYDLNQGGKLTGEFQVPGNRILYLTNQFRVFDKRAIFWDSTGNGQAFVWDMSNRRAPVALASLPNISNILPLDDHRFMFLSRDRNSHRLAIWDVEKRSLLKEFKRARIDNVLLIRDRGMIAISSRLRNDITKSATVIVSSKDFKTLATLPSGVIMLTNDQQFLFCLDGKYIHLESIGKSSPAKVSTLDFTNIAVQREAPILSKSGRFLGIKKIRDGQTLVSEVVDLAQGKVVSTLPGSILGFISENDAACFKQSGQIEIRAAVGGELKHAIDVRHPNFQPDGTLPRTRFQLSPDGTHVAVGIAGQVRLAKLSADRIHSRLPRSGHAGEITSIAASPDSRLIASGSRDQSIGFWHAKTGKFAGLIEGMATAIQQVEFSPSGKQLLCREQSGSLALWDIETNKALVQAKQRWAIKDLDARATSISADGKWVAAAQKSGDVVVVNAADGSIYTLIRSLAREANSLTRALQFHPQRNDELAVISGDGRIALWNLTQKTNRLSWATEQAVHAMTYSPDGKVVLTAGASVIAWDTHDGHKLLSLRHHAQDVIGVEFSRDGRDLLTYSSDGLVVKTDFQQLQRRLQTLQMPLSLRSHSPSIQTRAIAAKRIRWEVASQKIVQAAQTKLFLLPQARKAERSHNWSAAARHLSKVVGLRPSNDKLVLRLAWAHASESKWDMAIGDYRAVLKLSPKDLDAHYYLGICQLAKGDMQGYQETRAQVLKLFHTPRFKRSASRVVYASLHGRDATSEEKRILEKLAARTGQKRLRAAVHLRSKNYSQAIELLKGDRPNAFNRALLCIAYAKSAQKKLAQKTLNALRAELKKRSSSDWQSWHERAEVNALVRESTKLLK